jgi:hypothetical protein
MEQVASSAKEAVRQRPRFITVEDFGCNLTFD